MTQFQATIEIARPRDEVFAYLADAGAIPRLELRGRERRAPPRPGGRRERPVPGRSLLGTLAAHAIERGVDANLAALRDLLEHHTA